MVAAAIAAAVEQQATTTREIASSVQTVTVATGEASRAMQDVCAVVDTAATTNLTVTTAAVRSTSSSSALRGEVDDFLAVMAEGHETDRRRYERIPGRGAKVRLSLSGRTSTATIIDISRGGVALECDAVDPAGTVLQLSLPGVGGEVAGRVVRQADGLLAVAFGQDTTTLARIDQALLAISTGRSAAA